MTPSFFSVLKHFLVLKVRETWWLLVVIGWFALPFFDPVKGLIFWSDNVLHELSNTVCSGLTPILVLLYWLMFTLLLTIFFGIIYWLCSWFGDNWHKARELAVSEAKKR